MKDTLHSSPEIKALMALTWDGRLTPSSFSALTGLADALRRIANGPEHAGGWRRVAEWCMDQAREALSAAGMEA